MQVFLILTILPFIFCKELTIDLKDDVSISSINGAINTAKLKFRHDKDLTVIIKIPPGTHKLDFGRSRAVMLRGVYPGPNARLILRGAGQNETIIETDLWHTVLYGRAVHRFSVQDIHFTRSKPMASQGVVQKVEKGKVTLKIEAPHPGLDEIFDKHFRQGKYLRRYDNSDGDCKIIPSGPQVPWNWGKDLGNGTWELYLKNSRAMPDYPVGQLIGIKSKCCGAGKSGYWFCQGDDIAFERVTWSRQSRGVLRCGINNIKFINVSIIRDEGDWCLSTSDGGPQIGQPRDKAIRNVLIDGLHATGTGDDAVALFNVIGGAVVRNCVIRDSFARGILLYGSRYMKLENNDVVVVGM